MEKQLKKIKENMYQILNEINAIDFNYTNLQIDLWPKWDNDFKIRLWDGNEYAKSLKDKSDMTIQEFIDWIEQRKILFHKF